MGNEANAQGGQAGQGGQGQPGAQAGQSGQAAQAGQGEQGGQQGQGGNILGEGGSAGQGGNGSILGEGGQAGQGGQPGNVQGDGNADQGAPEKYESFKLGEGMVMPEAQLNAFTSLAKEINLSQANAQKLVDFQSKIVKDAHDSQMQASSQLVESWKQETLKMLGNNSSADIAVANRFLNTRADLKTILSDTGLINNPAVFKMVLDFGKMTTEDSLKGGGGTSSGAEGLPLEQRLYPSMTKK